MAIAQSLKRLAFQLHYRQCRLVNRLLPIIDLDGVRLHIAPSVYKPLENEHKVVQWIAAHSQTPSPLEMGLSGMVFPIAGALASESVFSSATDTNPNAVASLYSRYRCQFGAHCGLHTLRQAERERLSDRATVLGKQLLDGIADLARKHPLICNVRGPRSDDWF